MIKTFRGILAQDDNGAQTKILLQTIKGKVAYRIVKFQTIQKTPGGATAETVTQIFKQERTTAEQALSTIDFSDSNLLAVSFYSANTAAQTYPEDMTVIFDREIFNQDIFITSKDAATVNDPINYYLELEVIPLDDAGAEYTTLKDMRQPG